MLRNTVFGWRAGSTSSPMVAVVGIRLRRTLSFPLALCLRTLGRNRIVQAWYTARRAWSRTSSPVLHAGLMLTWFIVGLVLTWFIVAAALSPPPCRRRLLSPPPCRRRLLHFSYALARTAETSLPRWRRRRARREWRAIGAVERERVGTCVVGALTFPLLVRDLAVLVVRILRIVRQECSDR